MFRIFALTFTNVKLLFNLENQLIMAKNVGLIGSVSGKIGTVVFAVLNGIQTSRAYQPKVSNPKSTGQSMQRARGNLAGRISSFVPKSAIMGLGVNARLRRGEFLRNILKKATATYEQGSYVAKIQPADVLFSKGAVQLPVTLQSITAASHSVVVVLNGVAGTVIAPEVYASRLVRLVAMVYEHNTTNLVEVSTKLATMPAQGATSSTNIAIAHAGGYDVFVYAIPMSTEDGTAASVDTSVVGLDDNEIAASLSVNGNAVVFAYGQSVYMGDANFTQA